MHIYTCTRACAHVTIDGSNETIACMHTNRKREKKKKKGRKKSLCEVVTSFKHMHPTYLALVSSLATAATIAMLLLYLHCMLHDRVLD